MQWHRPRFSILYLGIAICASLTLALYDGSAAADETTPSPRGALDLPAGVAAKLDLPEDTLPPFVSIQLFGQEYTARSFVFCVERSWTMNCWTWGISTELQAAINGLPDTAKFSVVYYTQGGNSVYSRPMRATAATKQATFDWMDQSTLFESETCLLEGAVSAFNNGNGVGCRDQAVIMITSRDLGGADETLTHDAIVAANWLNSELHVLVPPGLMPDPMATTPDWLQQICQNSGGSMNALPQTFD